MQLLHVIRTSIEGIFNKINCIHQSTLRDLQGLVDVTYPRAIAELIAD